MVGGARENTSTFADYFASIGFVGVAAGYRLAPEFEWAEGGPRRGRRGDAVLFTTAEYDDPRYLKAHAALFSELVAKHGVRPRFR